tara:strand:+ start:179 stop:421 length:243 start_codon:yes stop_codon:yes gene_type:complete
MSFAKLYETELGQILVKLDEGDDGPEARYYFVPKDLGVCSVAVNFKGEDDWEKADRYFKTITEEKALSVVKGVLETIANN